MVGIAAIGVDIGGTHLRAARISPAGEILDWAARLTPRPQAIAEETVALVGSLAAPDVVAIGIGIPGRVDAVRGRILSGGYVDLSDVALPETVASGSGRPVSLDNDGNMALVAEQAIGAARGAGSVVMFTIGTGIGGAVIADGKILRGRMAAGQMGHITVDGAGKACRCGRHGCVETTSSGSALGRHVAEAGLPAGTTAESLLSRTSKGDATAKAVLAAWAAPMRIAIDTAVAIFDPELVVLGGGLGTAMHQALACFPAEAPWYRCEVVPAALGDRAGVIGAGLAALARRAEGACR